MEEEDRQNQDNDEGGGEEKDDRQEAGLVRWQLLQLHAGLDAAGKNGSWEAGIVAQFRASLEWSRRSTGKCPGVL
jgi:hypothetical protein